VRVVFNSKADLAFLFKKLKKNKLLKKNLFSIKIKEKRGLGD
jgi:hypothetical protein